jgi:DNA helicase-2/ATP-dependent DNA helicase PcrA
VKDSSLRSKLKRTAGQRLRAYLKRWPVPDPAEVYRSVFEEALKQNKPSPIPKKIAETTLASLSRGKIHLDDLAPLLYIQDRLYGMRGESAFDHTVIDEAQDFSPFQIELLRSRTRGGSFTILGDLSQGIHSYQGIEDWDEFLQLFEPGAAQYVQLEQSYRSTMEIIHFANSVLERGGDRFTPAVPVFRSGDPVVVESVPEADEARRTADAVREMRSAGAATVAVICRTDEDCRQAAQWLADAGIEATVLDAGQEEYLGGVSVIPVYWCKGLEFDSVLLLGVDEIRYQRNGRDAKLLYVGCTRALHRLRIMYTGQPSPLIQDIDSERSEKVKLNQ